MIKNKKNDNRITKRISSNARIPCYGNPAKRPSIRRDKDGRTLAISKRV